MSGPSHPHHDPTLADDRHLGHRLLRRFHSGALMHHERRTDVRFILDAATGEIVMPIEPGFAKAHLAEHAHSLDFTLLCPTEDDRELEVILQPNLIPRPESLECVDRWSAYHGRTSETFWTSCRIDSAKAPALGNAVFDHDQLQLPNPLGRAEFPLVRLANADAALLAAACKRHAGLTVAEPRCVGVDPHGIDIRARFGILRLEFPPGIIATEEPHARAALLTLVAQSPKP